MRLSWVGTILKTSQRTLLAMAPAALLLWPLMLMPGAAPRAADSAVIIMYHRFGEDGLPATNIRLDQFEAQIAELTSGKYTVLPLPEIAARLRAGAELPERTVGISIDDAFLSVYREAWPRLRAAKLPFTLFLVTDPLDRGSPDYMSWEQLRELTAGGVTIGNQTASHPHMPAHAKAENAAELSKSNQRIAAELGVTPTMIAYPYGEYSLAVGEEARKAGFTVGFGQHSGVAHVSAGMMFLPRFAMNEAFGDVARLRRAANALPIPVKDISPADPLLGPATNPPNFGFTLAETVPGIAAIACYTSQHGKAALELLGGRRVEVRLSRPFPEGRWRINCTVPAGDGRWRWFGRQFYIKSR